MKDIIFQKIFKALKDFNMIEKGDSILIALSGGPDSVMLLYVVKTLQKKFDLKLAAYHLNHMLRGKEAERDEEFSRKLANEWNIPFYSERIDIKKFKKEKGGSLEEIAREIRYKRYQYWREKLKFHKVALGHTKTDSIETFIYNLIRGSGLKGLSGIPPVRDFYIRPLIYLERDEIQEFLKTKNIPFIIDSTNLEPEFTRNKIRLQVLPLLEEIRKGATQKIFESSLILREAEEFIQWEVKKLLKEAHKEVFEGDWLLDTSLIRNYHLFIKKSLFHYLFGFGFDEVNSVLNILKKGGRIRLRDFQISSSFGELYISERERRFPVTVIQKPGVFKFEEFNLQVILEENRNHDHKTVYRINISPDYLPLVVRSRKEGDRVHGKKLKEYFIRKKIPEWRRELIPVFEHEGEIIWVPGIYLKRSIKGDLKLEVCKIHGEKFWIFDK